MDFQEREKFWKKLCSMPGEDVVTESKMLRNEIKFPKYLFRYRSVSMKNLEALRTNKLYFSSANYYDDPFDTFLYIDIERIKNEYLNILQTPERMEAIVEEVKPIMNKILTEEQMTKITVENVTKESFVQNALNSLLDSALALRDEVKKDIWSICFSENGYNETLWLKYADQHKGFVQIYDLENDENFMCGKQEKCVNCGIRKYGTPLYPIYYADKPYDATNYAKIIMFRKLEEIIGVTIPQHLSSAVGNELWERERTTLIKKKCHEYDQEWRMITGCIMKPPIMMEWVPDGIILGLRMDTAEENLVVSMAKEAGVKKIYKSYIDVKNQLNVYQI